MKKKVGSRITIGSVSNSFPLDLFMCFRYNLAGWAAGKFGPGKERGNFSTGWVGMTTFVKTFTV